MPRRKLKITGRLSIKDYDVWPDPDDWEHRDYNASIDKFESPVYATIMTDTLTCGGECRTEFEVQAKVLSDGVILANVTSRFFEGGNEWTGELEDSKSHRDVYVARSESTTVEQHLVNVDVPGNDESWLTLTFTNFPYED